MNRLASFRATAILVAALSLSLPAASAVVSFSVTSLGGNSWLYDYSIKNLDPSVAFDEVTVFFDQSLYRSLLEVSTPMGWDPLVVQPDSALSADGFYDVLSFSGHVAAGAVQSGFEVSFLYLKQGIPGPQLFNLIDSARFSVVASGQTQAAVSAVPEPATYLFLLAGVGGLVIRRVRTKPLARGPLRPSA